ncbi:hypothetical protein QG37_00873 [Candidozyma auris]|nr:hypothetical protein QG37_00873 [[Candida] auris]
MASGLPEPGFWLVEKVVFCFCSGTFMNNPQYMGFSKENLSQRQNLGKVPSFPANLAWSNWRGGLQGVQGCVVSSFTDFSFFFFFNFLGHRFSSIFTGFHRFSSIFTGFH